MIKYIFLQFNTKKNSIKNLLILYVVYQIKLDLLFIIKFLKYFMGKFFLLYKHRVLNFFKNTSYKIAEIGSHKGYSTKILSKIFSKVYAVDNHLQWTLFNKCYNKNSTNIEYVMLDIYKNNWEILPDDIEVSFIDADHSYTGCKSDIYNSLKQFKNLKYKK